MKTTLLMVAVLALAACGPKKAETPAFDSTSAAAPAPAPMPADTAMMQHDTTMHADTAMARDTTHK